jgi:alanine racemase
VNVDGRWAWAEVDLAAVRHNVVHLRTIAAPAAVWVVVKADAYGHGAAAVARAAVAAGAEGLCVALADEGIALREAGLLVPVLVLSQQPAEHYQSMLVHRLTPTLYDVRNVQACAAAAERVGAAGVPVHVKVDTGMHRVGCAPEDVVGVVSAIAAQAPHLRFEGLFTHLAIADEPSDPFTSLQLQRFDRVIVELAEQGVVPTLTHAANSAGALAHPAARRSFVRVGIAAYGIAPGAGVAALCAELRPALSLKSRVSLVRRVAMGEAISYGLRHRFERDTTVATVPVGYADGVPRRLFATGGSALIGGGRRPIVGVVTMDQLMLDCGDDQVAVGDEVVLIGAQGDEVVGADEWAGRLGTIGYEITCGISKRVPRRYLHEPDEVPPTAL